MPSNLLSVLDLVILVGYFLLIVWVGVRYSRQQKHADSYFVTKKRIPGWIMGLSMFAATLSCFTFIGFPGWTFRYDMQIIMREYMSIGAIIVCSILVIPIYRAVVKVSVFEYLEQRFGYFARIYSSLGTILGSPVGVGILLYILCLALNGLTGIDMYVLIFTIGVLTLVYTMWGGIEACIYTEAIHGAMFIGAGLLTLGYLLFFATPGGFGEITSAAVAGGKFKLIEPTIDVHTPTLFIFMWVGFFQFLTNYSAQPYVVQRYLVADSYKQAVRGSVLSVACCVVTWATFLSIGALLWAFYSIFPDRLADKSIEPDKIFPYFMGRELPTGLAGLILAGLLASGMSGISSALNSTAACVQSDFYDRLTHGKSDAKRLHVSRISVLVIGTLSIVIAILLTKWQGGVVQFAADIIMSVIGPVIGGSHLAIFFLGLFTLRTSKAGLYTGMAVGVIFSLWAITTNVESPIGKHTSQYLSFLPAYSWHSWMLYGFTSLVATSVGYIASRIINPGWKAPLALTVYGHSIWSEARQVAATAAAAAEAAKPAADADPAGK